MTEELNKAIGLSPGPFHETLNKLEEAKCAALCKCENDFKVAVPVWNFKTQTVDLLLPIKLRDTLALRLLKKNNSYDAFIENITRTHLWDAVLVNSIKGTWLYDNYTKLNKHNKEEVEGNPGNEEKTNTKIVEGKETTEEKQIVTNEIKETKETQRNRKKKINTDQTAEKNQTNPNETKKKN